MRLHNQVILIARTANELGEEIAQACASEGGTVICCASTDADSTAAPSISESDSGEIIRVEMDLRSEESIKKHLSSIKDIHGSVDVLVNNTAIVARTTDTNDRWRIDEYPTEIWDEIIEENLRSGFLLSREVLAAMRERGQGRLINLTTELGRYGHPKWGSYVATAYAIEGLHKTIALELAETDVDSLLFRPPRGATHIDTDANQMVFDSSMIIEPLLQLAAGEGENGEYYIGTEDGESFAPFDESDLWPIVDTREQVGPGNTLSWSVDLYPSDQLIIDARSVEGTVPVVAVEDPNHENVVTVDDINLGEQIRQEVEAATEGRYEIEFRNEAPLASGQWDITISLRD